ncbi:MAG TPA: Hsp20/alpha crystallin family protein [Anaerohalosphaeraceae bacterium]|nr:Hsp20/alpha crystallin family protein [Anaerohalosphaeraceae bacterium]HOL31623.1 Hsp20/alpha crystallin family protein [Anaerohalosphaeraceae bacterium]HOM75915.1 Hsp20/alpha crystallin family protein [Anaerohalosphaeraceae bacterium]HPC63714.1 Hsp20/alpha crystallin family protein [Anaerohalosphaeraceae bacterium]HPO69016.1 Hsp20/alpha crystallin family protein [Anaerohalosphaeraceae bacterium]
MVFHEMVPWKKDRRNVKVRTEQDEFPLMSLQRRMNRLFDDFFGDFGDFSLSPFRSLARGANEFIPRIDVTENDTEITVTAELAGMDEKDIEITLQDDVLTIKGEKKAEREEKDVNRYLCERSYGSFCRAIELPAEIQQDKIEATCKKGILTVRLPKTPAAQSKAKKIEVKGE